jgi:hypothetical protein
MKRVFCLLLLTALAGTGCEMELWTLPGTTPATPSVAPAPVAPPPTGKQPPVTAEQVNENNYQEIERQLKLEMDRDEQGELHLQIEGKVKKEKE